MGPAALGSQCLPARAVARGCALWRTTDREVESALARELLVHAMFALKAAGYPIVFTVHDEIVVEHPDIAKETLERIMSERPPWAEKLGVPVRAKAWIGKRYRK